MEKFFLLRKDFGNTILWGMDSPEIIHERFFKILKEKDDAYGRGFNKFLHHETGLSTSYLSLLLGGHKKASQKTQMKILAALKIDYNSIIDPQEAPRKKDNNIISFRNEIEQRHFRVVQSFEDAEYALMLNTYLAELEKLDVEAYEAIGAKVRGMVRKIKRQQAEKQAEAEKAMLETPDEKEA